MMDHPPIPVGELSERINDMKAENNSKFSQEYEVYAKSLVIQKVSALNPTLSKVLYCCRK